MFFLMSLFLFFGSLSAMHSNNPRNASFSTASSLPASLSHENTNPDDNYMEELANRPECPVLTCLCLSCFYLGYTILTNQTQKQHLQ